MGKEEEDLPLPACGGNWSSVLEGKLMNFRGLKFND